jgi:ABC-2 type transport system permease protein
VNTFLILLGQRFRRDRVQLLMWMLGTAGLALLAANSVAGNFGSEEERAGVLRLAIANPTILLFRGTPNGAEIGEFTFFLIYAFLALMGGLMSTFLAVRHSRADEEVGRAELIASTPAGRTLPTVSTLVHGVLANVALGVLTAGAFIAAGLDATGSFVAGAAITASGIAFLAFGLFVAQLVRTARGANSASVAFVVGSYVVRGIGDAAGSPTSDPTRLTPAWPSWLVPIGWGQRTGAYTDNDLAPLLIALGFAGVLVTLVFWLQSVRDQGASLLPGRAGRATAGAVLSSSTGLAWRLNASTILWWAVGAAVAGLLATSLAEVIAQVGEEVPDVAQTLQGSLGAGATLEQALMATIFGIVGVLAACCAVQIAIRARQEEARGTAELVLAGSVPRTRWIVDFLVIGVAGITLVLGTALVFAVLGAQNGDRRETVVAEVTDAALGQFPAALVYLGCALLILALVPRVTIALSWLLVGLGAIFGIFGDLVGLPEWLVNASPFTHSPTPVGNEVDWGGGIVMLGVAVVAAALAVAAMRRRELTPDG